jgi:hypothetical protein
MESGSFSEFMNLSNQNNQYLGDLIYKKVRYAILYNLDSAVLFTMFPTENESSSQGFVFTLPRNQFYQFLDEYLKRCEENERYEICSEIIDLKELF